VVVALAVARVLFVVADAVDVVADDARAKAVERAPAHRAFGALQCRRAVATGLALCNAPKCFDCR